MKHVHLLGGRIAAALIGCAILFAARLVSAQTAESTVTPSNSTLLLQFPPLSGSYAVGRAFMALDDSARAEVFTDDANDTRRIPVTFYYPIDAATASAATAPAATAYIPENIRGPFAQALGFPPTLFAQIGAHASDNAPAASSDQGFPVLLFSPGFGVALPLYTSLLEQVASHGYVVAAIDHPYSQSISFFPDGSSVTQNAAGTNLNDETNNRLIGQVWTDDTRAVLDWLQTLNASDPVLTGALDLTKNGAFGHSFGGAAAVRIMVEDARVQATIDIDGSLMLDSIGTAISGPVLMMRSVETASQMDGTSAPTEAQIAEILSQNNMTREQYDQLMQQAVDSTEALRTAPQLTEMIVADTVHLSYVTDLPLIRTALPILPESLTGSVDPYRLLTVVTDTTVGFFNQELLGQNGAFDAIVSGANADGAYPELSLVPNES
ncbi:MAG: hypothetical protein U0670_21570 [Anaerolineae bacterium]